LVVFSETVRTRVLGGSASAHEDLDGACCTLDPGSLATPAVGDADTRGVDLALAGLAAQLPHDLYDLSGACSPEGMALA
jgi:hypothetical protein